MKIEKSKFDFNLKGARIAGKLKVMLEETGFAIDIRDLLIGAIALSNDLSLKTNNKKHFERMKKFGLRMVKC